MNNVLEQYGISARVMRSLREKNAKKSSEEKSSNNNELLPCNGSEIMTEAYSDGKKAKSVKVQSPLEYLLAN